MLAIVYLCYVWFAQILHHLLFELKTSIEPQLLGQCYFRHIPSLPAKDRERRLTLVTLIIAVSAQCQDYPLNALPGNLGTHPMNSRRKEANSHVMRIANGHNCLRFQTVQPAVTSCLNYL